MKLDLKAIEESWRDINDSPSYDDIKSLLAFAKDAKEVLEQISDLKNPTKLEYICWPKSEYMTIAREVLQRWFGDLKTE